MPTYRKNSSDVIDFGFDWSDWLASGETISSSTWSVPSGLTEDSSDNSTTQTSVWLSGGTAGSKYTISNTIVTSAERTKVRYIDILVNPPSYALITVNELKNFPNMASLDVTDEPILHTLIDAVTAEFESYWGTYGVIRGVSGEKVTYKQLRRASPGANIMPLQKTPIQSVVSIEDQDSNTIDSDDYWIDESRGLMTTGGWTIPQDSSAFATYWSVTYSGGWVSSTSNVPENIKTAAKMRVASLYKRADRDVISKQVGDLRITYREGADEGLPSVIKNMINQWRRIEL